MKTSTELTSWFLCFVVLEVTRGYFYEKSLSCWSSIAKCRCSAMLLGFLLMTPPTGFFPVPTPWVGSVVEEDRLARGWDRWRGSAGGLEPTGSRLGRSPKRTQRLTGIVGGMRLRRPQLGVQAPEVSKYDIKPISLIIRFHYIICIVYWCTDCTTWTGAFCLKLWLWFFVFITS